MAEIPLKVPELKPNYYIQGVIKVNTEQLWRVMEETTKVRRDSQVEELAKKQKEKGKKEVTREQNRLPVDMDACELKAALRKMGLDWAQCFTDNTFIALIKVFNDEGQEVERLSFDQFSSIYQYLNDWHAAFVSNGRPENNQIPLASLPHTLKKFGYHLSSEILAMIMKKLEEKPANQRPLQQIITLEKFIQICAYIQRLTNWFQWKDGWRAGRTVFTYDEWIKCSLGSTAPWNF